MTSSWRTLLVSPWTPVVNPPHRAPMRTPFFRDGDVRTCSTRQQLVARRRSEHANATGRRCVIASGHPALRGLLDLDRVSNRPIDDGDVSTLPAWPGSRNSADASERTQPVDMQPAGCL